MINLIHGDCLEYMRKMPDNAFDLAIVDPPYGIGISNNMGRRKGDKHSGHKVVEWDDCIPNDEYFKQLYRVSKNQIIWGANYFPQMPPCKGFIIWSKPQISEKMSFSMCEYAYCSFANKTSKIFNLCNTENKIHPTQKPVALYKWILSNYAKKGDKILDTHFGSGSLGIACHDGGFDLEAYEIDKDYYEASKKRLEIHQMQLKLF